VRLTPEALTLANYINLFEVLPFAKYFRNSAVVACSTVVFTLLLAIPAAYGFARYRFRGRRLLLMGLLLLYLIPPIVLLVPLLIIFKSLGLINTYRGLILAEASSTIPFAVWLLVGFFAALPRELEEAAMVDGCSPLGALMRVILPLSTPGIVAAGLFIFIVAWNDFLYAFLFASGEGVKTLPVVMRMFVRGESGVFWGTVMASAALTTLPVAAVFLFFQKYLIGGLSAGAVKG
jgi:ABC-type glycerol-3-phosphate transport system permease component